MMGGGETGTKGDVKILRLDDRTDDGSWGKQPGSREAGWFCPTNASQTRATATQEPNFFNKSQFSVLLPGGSPMGELGGTARGD